MAGRLHREGEGGGGQESVASRERDQKDALAFWLGGQHGDAALENLGKCLCQGHYIPDGKNRILFLIGQPQ